MADNKVEVRVSGDGQVLAVGRHNYPACAIFRGGDQCTCDAQSSVHRLVDRALLDARRDAELKTDESMGAAVASRAALLRALDCQKQTPSEEGAAVDQASDRHLGEDDPKYSGVCGVSGCSCNSDREE
jgi:hypothetical protein